MFASTLAPPELSASEYELWREFIWERCGMYFAEYRLRFLRQRLWERMRPRQIQSYGEYYRFIAYNIQGQAEWLELLELLLNQETSFFRHQPSFTALTGHALPELIRKKQAHAPQQIAIWSVGCSTGQEPYSLAMICLELFNADLQAGKTSFAITGSDISQHALEKARRGHYRPHEMRFISDQYREKYLTKLGERQGYQVIDPVRALVQFEDLNLGQPDRYRVAGQDVIFCQNVLIYFKPETRLEIVQRLCQSLNPGGYLFLAPAELVGQKLPAMQLVRLTDVLVYRKET